MMDSAAQTKESAEEFEQTATSESVSDEIFIYFANYYRELKDEIYRSLTEKRQIVLTIMSFCLIAEMTYIASAGSTFDGQYANLEKGLLIASLVLWSIAFVVALFIAWRIVKSYCRLNSAEDMEFLSVTGDAGKYIHDSSLRVRFASRFLPSDTRKNLFPATRSNRTNYLIYRGLMRAGKVEDISALPKKNIDLVKLFNEKVKDRPTLPDFNKNAWLGKLSRALTRVLINSQLSRWKFRFVYCLFFLSMLAFFAAVVLRFFG